MTDFDFVELPCVRRNGIEFIAVLRIDQIAEFWANNNDYPTGKTLIRLVGIEREILCRLTYLELMDHLSRNRGVQSGRINLWSPPNYEEAPTRDTFETRKVESRSVQAAGFTTKQVVERIDAVAKQESHIVLNRTTPIMRLREWGRIDAAELKAFWEMYCAKHAPAGDNTALRPEDMLLAQFIAYRNHIDWIKIPGVGQITASKILGILAEALGNDPVTTTD